MGRVFPAVYTAPVPPGAKVTSRAGKRWVTLTVRKRPVTCEVRAVNGRDRAVVPTGKYAVEWTDGAGKSRQRTVSADRRTAAAALARLEEQAARARHGLPDPAAEAAARSRPLADLAREYLEVLAGRDTSPAYRATARRHLADLQAHCKWAAWADVTGDSLTRYLGRLRDGAVPGRKGGRRGDAGASPATLNSIIRTAKAFANWCADRLDARSPLRGVKPYPGDRDRRRSRRVLTDAEFDALLAATQKAPRRHNTLIPPADRAVLYLVAGLTGLRASELARLTPAAFDLDAAAVTVFGKGKREETTPVPDHLLARLREFLAGKPAGKPLWPGTWAAHRRQVKWLAGDARRAGLGEGVTFHGLRRRYVTALLRAGHAADVVRRLARHRDLRTTMDYYATQTPDDLRRAADSLPRAGG